MALSNDLISQFAKLTNDKPKTNTESLVYGKAIRDGATTLVQLDGSDIWTPATSTVTVTATNTSDAERVTVLVKDHNATVIGNSSDPSASASSSQENNQRLDDFDILVAHRVTTDELNALDGYIQKLRSIAISCNELDAVEADIETLMAKFANVEYLSAKDIEAITADITNLNAKYAEFNYVDVEDLNAANATFEQLSAHVGDFTYVSTEKLEAAEAQIKNLNAEKADIDFANINEAAINKVLADYMIATDIIGQNGKFVKELVGVTIKGDLIEAGTLKVDKLIVKGTDGNYYALNTDFTAMPGVERVEEDAIHGSVLVKKSIAAEKIAVSELAAFDATIGGFHIKGIEDDIPGAIYSGSKATIDAPFDGIYLDSEGQVAFGNNTNHLKYYKDSDGVYRLIVSADNIVFGAGKKFFLDDRGMTIEGSSTDSNNTIKTIISNNGMAVNVRNEVEPTLEANDKGVVAKDLYATTYLIVGDNSRFENYGNGRTGCFWIGG